MKDFGKILKSIRHKDLKQKNLIDLSPLKERTLRRIEAGQNIGLRNFIIAIKGLNFNYWVLRQGSNWTIEQAYEYIVDLIDELAYV